MCPDFKYISLAKRLNDHHRQALIVCKARFRGSLNSISFISLRCNTPQLGFACSYEALKNVEEVNIGWYCKKLSELLPPQRPTPEKKLQSCIIREAQEKGAFPFDQAIQLFTDEFARINNGNKLVIDLFGFNTVTGSFVLIELKSARSLTELVRQLNNAEEVIRQEPQYFQCLLKDGGFEWREPFPIEKIAIWPPAQTVRPKIFPDDIREFTYSPEADGCCFVFQEGY
jgi:hypothetical protein